MQSTRNTFKQDAIRAIWDHGVRMIKPTIVIGIVMSLVSMILIALGFVSMFGWDMELIGQMMSGNPFARQEMLTERMNDISANPFMIFRSFALVFIILFIFQALVYTLLLKMSGNIVEGNGGNLSLAWSQVKFSHILSILGSFLILLVIYALLGLASGLLAAAISPATLILTLPLLLLVIVRFTAVVPAIALGDMDMMDAYSFSWKVLTLKRAAFIILGFIVFGIISVIVSLLISSLAGLLGSIGIALNLIFNLILNIFFLALGVSFLTGLYYRYAQIEGDNLEIDSIGLE